jgi:hypothetical protein
MIKDYVEVIWWGWRVGIGKLSSLPGFLLAEAAAATQYVKLWA